MTTLRNQIGSGTAPQAAQADQGFITNGVNVTGSTAQGNQAFPSDFVVVTTAPGSAGLTLPSNAAPTDSYVLVNHGGSACLVWPPSGGPPNQSTVVPTPPNSLGRVIRANSATLALASNAAVGILTTGVT